MPDPLRQSLSATEVPALYNASPYTTRWMLYQKFANDNVPARDEDNRMTWGKRLQPLLLEAAAEDLKLEVRPNHAEEYVRSEVLRMGCTRDAEIICPDRGPGALETKAVFDYKVWMNKWDGGETPPQEYELQLQEQMLVGDGKGNSFKWGTLAAWVCGEMHYFERNPITSLWESMTLETERFFNAVIAKREPPPSGIEAEKKLLVDVYPAVLGAVLDLSELASGDSEEELTENKRRLDLAQEVAMLNYHSDTRLGHERAEKAIKTRMLALGAGVSKVLLPHGIELKLKTTERAGYVAKPSKFTVLDWHVPLNAPVGNIYGLEPLKNGQ